LAAILSLLTLGAFDGSRVVSSDPTPPNILFIVQDDLGVDQLPVFGYGGATPATTPAIDAIARAGVRFRNAWSMPTCKTWWVAEPIVRATAISTAWLTRLI